MENNEVLIKFDVQEDAFRFIEWFDIYGQHLFYNSERDHINNNIDFEKNIINVS